MTEGKKRIEDFGVTRTLRATFLKPRPDLPYMTSAERSVMKDLIRAGSLGFYRLGVCKRDGCKEEVTKDKRFCTQQCYALAEGKPKEASDGDDEEG